MQKAAKIGWSLLAGIVAAVVISAFWLLFSGSKWATVQVGEEKFTFRLADSSLEHFKGLSDLPIGQLNADGMLFVFRDDAIRTFVMRGMQFNLDILWVRDNKIVDIDYGVPAPVGGEKPVSINSDPLLADMVIEVPAGRAREMNFQIGHTLTINLDGTEEK